MATQKTKEISSEIRESIASQIISLIQEKGLSWSKGFDASLFLAQNPITPTKYRGINRMWLALSMMENHYEDPRFCTFLQAKANGWKIKRGAHAQHVECYKEMAFAIIDGEPKFLSKAERESMDPEDVHWRMCLASISNVFNFEDIEGPTPYLPQAPSTGFELADELISSSRCPVFEAGVESACYIPAKDEILMPPRSVFDEPCEFTATLLHEMAHSTALPLKRDAFGEKHSDKYAFEELCAEIACVFAGAELGLALGQARLENHAAYIQCWNKAFKEDSSVIFKAITEAQEIADYLIAGVLSVRANKAA